MGEVALAAEEQAADLFLELLNGAAQRRLRDIAFLRRPREIQGLAHCQEISDVMDIQGLLSVFDPQTMVAVFPDTEQAAKKSAMMPV